MLTTGEARPPALTWTEVDGVPTVWAPVEGPLAASLIFRVGRADETLTTSGVTHLVEHLALYREGLSSTSPHFNGQVDDITAMFYMVDEPEVACGFLTRVCGHLGNLPEERLLTEREILRSEAANRNLGGGYLSLLRWRYGPRSYGLGAYEEYGMYRLQADEATQWAADRFVRQNAVLVLTGAPPAGLRMPLPDGERHATSAATSALPQLPAWYAEGDPGAALSAVVERSTTATALRHVVEYRLTSRLRYDLGASYSPGVVYEPRDDTYGHLFIGADAVPDHADAVRREVATVLTELTEDDVVSADLESWRRMFRQSFIEAGARRGWLHTQAHDLLLGREPLDFEQWQREIEEITPDEVVALARQAHDTSLLRLGGQFDHDLTDRAAAPVWSDGGPVVGPSYQEIRAEPKAPSSVLVVTPVVAAVDLGRERRVKTWYSEVAAALRWPDGQITLIANDAFTLRIDPAVWVDGSEAVAKVGAGVPVDRWVDMPARTIEPRPTFGEPVAQWVALLVLVGAVAASLGLMLSGAVHIFLGPVLLALGAYYTATQLITIRRVRGLRPLGRRRASAAQ